MHKKIVFGLAIGWTVLIAFLCLIKSNDLPSLRFKNLDKFVHVALHFVFVLIWGYYSRLKRNKIEIGKILQIMTLSFLYGVTIEFLQQYLTTTRQADVFDVMANFIGALSAFLVLVWAKRTFKENFSNN